MKHSIQGLRDVLEERKTSTVDIVSQFTMLERDGTVMLNIGGHGTYTISPFAHNNLAIHCNIPKLYYDQLLNNYPDILCTIVNRHPNDKMLCRIFDGGIRAILSDHYKIIDNHDLLTWVIDAMPKGMTGYEGTLTDRMYVKFIGKGKIPVGEHTITPGIAIQNSEIGTGAVRVDLFALVNDPDCCMIISQPTTKIHLGKKVDAGIVDTSGDHELVKQQVRQMIEHATDPKRIGVVTAVMRNNALQTIDKPIETVDRIVKNTHINTSDALQFLNRFLDKSIKTRWSLALATATTATLVGDHDKEITLERIAGMIATDRGTSVQTALT